MGRILSATGLPPPVVSAVRPWIGVVETATLGAGDAVRATAGNAAVGLRRRVVVTPPLEQALEHARDTSHALAVELDSGSTAPTAARSAAMAALGELLAALAGVEPNGRAKGLGLGW